MAAVDWGAVLERVKVNMLDILSAIAILAVGVLFAQFVRAIMRRSLAPRLPPHAYKPLENAVFYGLAILAGVLALYPLGLNLSSLVVAGGLTGIVVGLAAQNALGNLISGVFLLIEQPLRVGDPITVAGVSGVVANISFLSTTIRTWDGTLVRIPNSTVFNEQIVNYYRTRARRVEFLIGIHYQSSIEKAVEALMRLMDGHPYCLVNPAPEVFVEEYADSSVNLRVRCWAPPQVWFSTKTSLLTRLKSALEEAGVEIPYPQLDLHIASSQATLRVELEGGRST
ncbi:MAG: mechanosensitive ion channel family protein [Desulfurococcales archaeon]|nr:mechanosensitive ion channel family protein [Desulfurococcales archaeon]